MKSKDDRPNIVKYFEIMNLTVLFIGVIIAAISYKQTLEIANPLFIGFMQFFVWIIMLWIILAITRKRSGVAKWIFIITFVVGIPLYIPHLSNMLSSGIEGFLSISQLALQSISIYLLFQPEFTEYLKSEESNNNSYGKIKYLNNGS